MHDIKLIRKNSKLFIKKISDRNVNVDLKNLLSFDAKNRDLIKNKELLEQKKKIISNKKDKNLFQKSKEISLKIDQLSKDQKILKNKIDAIIINIPNIALDEVPIGKNENANKEIKKNGKIPNFDFKPLSHDLIGKNLNQMDFDTATKTSGSRFVFLKKILH